LTEVAKKYPELTITSSLEKYDLEYFADSINEAADEGDTEYADHLRGISDAIDIDSSESRVDVTITGNDESRIELAKEDVNVKAIDRGGKVVLPLDITENTKLSPFITRENPQGYVDGNRLKANGVYGFGARDEE